jgi:hypothetical protein
MRSGCDLARLGILADRDDGYLLQISTSRSSGRSISSLGLKPAQETRALYRQLLGQDVTGREI